jgi:hypothetical protein
VCSLVRLPGYRALSLYICPLGVSADRKLIQDILYSFGKGLVIGNKYGFHLVDYLLLSIIQLFWLFYLSDSKDGIDRRNQDKGDDVENVRPPKMAIAIGFHISEPLPLERIIGIMARIIVSES